MATKTLQAMVFEAASLHSGKITVTFDKGTTEKCTVLLRPYYSEDVALGNELTLLQTQRVQNTRTVALYCQTDVNLPVWILG
uniref:Uncharacterized protein n=1 Tax=Hucho hucho TaxID=62062 RepID=A0A4W5PEW2_9TELE